MKSLSNLLPGVRAIAEDAGEAIMQVYSREFEVEDKADDSPLTEADLAAHRIIVAGLEALTPSTPCLSEEGEAVEFETRRGWSRYWLIDPLDGTREFVKKNGEFTVNIALIEDGEPVLGVVHAPVQKRSWIGARGVGAEKITEHDSAPLRTAVADPSRPRLLVSKSHNNDETRALLERFDDYEALSVGSSLKFCVVAEGAADFYPRLGPTSEWDTAAAHAVLLEAGGNMVDTAGKPLRYNQKESILNPHFLAFGDSKIDWLAYLED